MIYSEIKTKNTRFYYINKCNLFMGNILTHTFDGDIDGGCVGEINGGCVGEINGGCVGCAILGVIDGDIIALGEILGDLDGDH